MCTDYYWKAGGGVQDIKRLILHFFTVTKFSFRAIKDKAGSNAWTRVRNQNFGNTGSKLATYKLNWPLHVLCLAGTVFLKNWIQCIWIGNVSFTLPILPDYLVFYSKHEQIMMLQCLHRHFRLQPQFQNVMFQICKLNYLFKRGMYQIILQCFQGYWVIIMTFIAEEISNIFNHLDARNLWPRVRSRQNILSSLHDMLLDLPMFSKIMRVWHDYNFNSNLSLQVICQVGIINNHKTSVT